eukprot:168985-Pleurochrysis_carterae.AAC.1
MVLGAELVRGRTTHGARRQKGTALGAMRREKTAFGTRRREGSVHGTRRREGTANGARPRMGNLLGAMQLFLIPIPCLSEEIYSTNVIALFMYVVFEFFVVTG